MGKLRKILFSLFIFCTIILVPISAKAKIKLSITDIKVENNKVSLTVHANANDEYSVWMSITSLDGECNGFSTYFSDSLDDSKSVRFDMTSTFKQQGLYEIDCELADEINQYGSPGDTFACATKYVLVTIENGSISIGDYDYSTRAYQDVSPKDKKTISKLMGKFFKNVKEYNYPGMMSCLKKTPKFSTVKEVSAKGFIRKAHRSRLKYEVKSVKVSEKTAQVKVYIEHYYASVPIQRAMKNVLKEYIRTRKISYPKILSDMKKYYKKDKTLINYTFTINLVKNKGSWKIKEMNKALRDVTDCGIMSLIDYYKKHPSELIF
ncbi:hypothetical protein [Butyrivibrio sp. INlla16]|uniref:hypothetical protein n=1 Tax=Butyrivibrio sp. INlla16 TaxID=1520807 RepID=UPI00088269A3|nr:hypothetical protein [Butyrivibrio sp. INlla16]SDB62664.1 hypothetical protein SAMN02910263_03393 [Butyrivibrio sp. INlla16]